MHQGIYNPEFYGGLVYEFKKIVGNPNFSYLFKRIVYRFKRAGYFLCWRHTVPKLTQDGHTNVEFRAKFVPNFDINQSTAEVITMYRRSHDCTRTQHKGSKKVLRKQHGDVILSTILPEGDTRVFLKKK